MCWRTVWNWRRRLPLWRKKEKIIVRQPLQCIAIPATDAQQKENIEAVKQLILDEINVKELQFVDGSGMLVKKVKCNFRTMGKKYGKLMKSVAALVDAMTQEQIAALESNGNISLTLPEGEPVEVCLEDVEIFSEDIPGWTVANEGSVTVALDITITEELKNEGVAREIIKAIQTQRKESGLEITDRIQVQIVNSPLVSSVVEKFGDYISAQVLANSIELVDSLEGALEVSLDGETVLLSLSKA